MRELHVDRDNFDTLFEKTADNFDEIYDDLRSLRTSISNLSDSVSRGTIVTGVRVSVDSTASQAPTCDARMVDDGHGGSILDLTFHGLNGTPGATGSNGTRGNIIYIGTNTTDEEAADRLTLMTGSDQFILGDLFIKTGTFELMQCVRAGVPSEARFNLIGTIKGDPGDAGEGGGGGTQPELPTQPTIDPLSIFTGGKAQVVLGDGSYLNISDLFSKNANGIKTATGWFKGGRNEFAMGNGTTLTISDFITQNIEAMRSTLGVATKEREGFTPKLPENPQG